MSRTAPSPRAAIAVPCGYGSFTARQIIVARDGSAPAARAAEAVEIVAVGGGAENDGPVPGAAFAPHLAQHGVNVTVTDRAIAGSVADTLPARAEPFRADMIVMGGLPARPGTGVRLRRGDTRAPRRVSRPSVPGALSRRGLP